MVDDSGVSGSIDEVRGCCLGGGDVDRGEIVFGMMNSPAVECWDRSWTSCWSVGGLGRVDVVFFFFFLISPAVVGLDYVWS